MKKKSQTTYIIAISQDMFGVTSWERHWSYEANVANKSWTKGRILDNTRARHSSVIVNNDRAFIVYHVQPFLKQNINTHESGDEVYQKISFIQMTELFYKDGKIICNRK